MTVFDWLSAYFCAAVRGFAFLVNAIVVSIGVLVVFSMAMVAVVVVLKLCMFVLFALPTL